jgi:hypothetical protein
MVSGGVPKAMVSYLGKWDGLFARLLCAYHVIAYAAEGMEPPTMVDEGCAASVCGLMKGLLLRHGLIFYEQIIAQSDRCQHAKWIAGYVLTRGVSQIRVSDVAAQYHEWRSLDAGTKSEAFNILMECDWIRPDPTGNVDRASRMPKRYIVNPMAAGLFAEQAAKEIQARKAARELLAENISDHIDQQTNFNEKH